MKGMEMLKRSFMLAYQTTRTLVMIMVPRLPWSLERFHTPFTVDTISSMGRSLRFLFSRMAPLSLSSLYILLELKALKVNITITGHRSRQTDLYTPMTEVKSLGLPGRRLVKMNSNLVWLHLVSR